MATIDTRAARRMALARAGLLKPEWTGAKNRSPRKEADRRRVAVDVIRRTGYLQLDTVSVAGARSHAIVLMSRLEGFSPDLAEDLLRPGAELFEYWGHEASWLPIELYPLFEFRRRDFRAHPWWGDLVAEHPQVAERLRKRIRDEGPLRSTEMEGQSGSGWWDFKLAKKVATALWSSGELAIRQRKRFQRVYDLTERVIPERWRRDVVEDQDEALARLLLIALAGHGWATRTTLAQTWRLRNRRHAIERALARLTESGQIVPCRLVSANDGSKLGYVRPGDLELAERLRRARPRTDRGVLLSPFDPLLWDRSRVRDLFGFNQVLEIFKPAAKRIYGYYCMPVLAGDRLVARYDLKADRKRGLLRVVAEHHEQPTNRQAARHALKRYANALELALSP